MKRPAGGIKKSGCNTSRVKRQSEVANRQPPMSLKAGGEGMESRMTEVSEYGGLAMPAI